MAGEEGQTLGQIPSIKPGIHTMDGNEEEDDDDDYDYDDDDDDDDKQPAFTGH